MTPWMVMIWDARLGRWFVVKGDLTLAQASDLKDGLVDVGFDRRDVRMVEGT